MPDLAEQRDIGEIARELNIILPEPVTPAGDDDDVEDPNLPDRPQDAGGQNPEPSSEINDTAESEESMRTAADGGG